MSSDASESEAGGDDFKTQSKTKIFVNNLNGFLQKYLVKALLELGNFEISGSVEDVTKIPVGVESAVDKVPSYLRTINHSTHHTRPLTTLTLRTHATHSHTHTTHTTHTTRTTHHSYTHTTHTTHSYHSHPHTHPHNLRYPHLLLLCPL
jgi:hypothetical protein